MPGFLKINQTTFLALCFAALPFIFSSDIIDPVLVPRFLFTAVVVLTILVWRLVKKQGSTKSHRFFKSIYAVPIYVLMGCTLLSIYSSTSLSESLFSVTSTLLFFTLLYLMIDILSGDLQKINTVIKGVVVFSIVITAIGFYQLYLFSPGFPIPLKEIYAINSSLAHKNLFASACLIALFFTTYGIVVFKNYWRWLATLTTIANLTFIILLQTRSAQLALFAALLGLIGLLLFERFFKRFWQRFRLRNLFWTACIAIAGLTVLHIYPEGVLNNLENAKGIAENNDRSFTIKERSLLWEKTTVMIFSESYWGVGPGNWKIVFPKYGSGIWRARQGMVQFQRPHNDFLWVWSESGVIAFFSHLLIFISILVMGIKMLMRDQLPKEQIWLIRLSIMAILAYIVVAFFSFPKERMIHQWLLIFSFAIIISLYFKETNQHSKFRLGLLFIPFVLFSVWIGTQRYRGEKGSMEMMGLRQSGLWSQLLLEHRELADLSAYTMDPVSLPVDFYAGLAHLELKNLDESLHYSKKAFKIHPHNIHVINNLGSTHQLMGHSEEAIANYEKALKIAPFYKDGVLNLCAAYFNNNQVEDAYQTLYLNHQKFTSEDQSYQMYLLAILRTIALNLTEQQRDDKWLLNCYSEAYSDNKNIEKVMLKNSRTLNKQ